MAIFANFCYELTELQRPVYELFDTDTYESLGKVVILDVNEWEEYERLKMAREAEGGRD